MGYPKEWLMLADGDEAAPRKEIMLFPFGTFSHPQYGDMVFDDAFFRKIIENYEDDALNIKPFMDEDHNMGKALAWFENPPYVRQGEGLFIRPKYTQLGLDLLSKKLFRYFSPWFEENYKDVATGEKFGPVLRGGAATNVPFLKVMPPIIDEAKRANSKPVSIELNELTATDTEAKTVEPKSDETATPMKGSGRVKIDIDGGITMAFPVKKPATPAEEPETALETHVHIHTGAQSPAKAPAPAGEGKEGGEGGDSMGELASKICEELGLKAGSSMEEMMAELSKLKQMSSKQMSEKSEGVKLNERIQLMEAEIAKRDAKECIGAALREGKILPKSKDYWEKRFLSDPKNVKADIEQMPVIVELTEKGYSGGEGIPDETDTSVKMSESARDFLTEAKRIQAEKKILKLSDAFREVEKTDPKLAERYYSENYGPQKGRR